MGLCWDIHLPFSEWVVLTHTMRVYHCVQLLVYLRNAAWEGGTMAYHGYGYTVVMGCDVVAPLDDMILRLQAFSLAIACTR